MQYVSLSIVEKEEGKDPEDPKCVELSEILNCKSQSGTKCVLIEGVVGTGKSTLVNKLCHDYAQGKFAREYDVVVRVVLRSLEDGVDATLEDLLSTSAVGLQHPLTTEEIEKLATYIKGRNGEGVLFIIDGWDELSEEMRKESIVQTLFSKSYPHLRDASVVMTSRPEATTSIKGMADRRIKVTGFKEEQIEKFTSSYFSKSPSQGEDLLLTLSDRPQLLSLSFIPLLLTMMCFVAARMKKSLPEKLNHLYHLIICISVNRDLEKMSPTSRKFESIEEICRVLPQFKKICVLALDGMTKNQQIFRETGLSEKDCFGLLSCVQERTLFGTIRLSFQFIHFSLQEYLAAHALAQLPDQEQVQFWKNYLHLGYNKDGRFILAQPQFSQMFLFYSGITSLQSRGLQSMLLSVVSKRMDGLFLGNCPFPELSSVAFESGNVQFTQELMSACGNEIEMILPRNEPDWIRQLMWCVEQHKQITSLSLFQSYPSTESVGLACKMLQQVTTLQKITMAVVFSKEEDRKCKFVPH